MAPPLFHSTHYGPDGPQRQGALPFQKTEEKKVPVSVPTEPEEEEWTAEDYVEAAVVSFPTILMLYIGWHYMKTKSSDAAPDGGSQAQASENKGGELQEELNACEEDNRTLRDELKLWKNGTNFVKQGQIYANCSKCEKISNFTIQQNDEYVCDACHEGKFAKIERAGSQEAYRDLITYLLKEIKTLEGNNKDLKKTNDDKEGLSRELSEAKINLGSLQEDTNRLKKDLENAKKHLEGQQQQVEDVKNKNAELQRVIDLNNYKKSTEEKQEKIYNGLLKIHQATKTENENLKKELQLTQNGNVLCSGSYYVKCRKNGCTAYTLYEKEGGKVCSACNSKLIDNNNQEFQWTWEKVVETNTGYIKDLIESRKQIADSILRCSYPQGVTGTEFGSGDILYYNGPNLFYSLKDHIERFRSFRTQAVECIKDAFGITLNGYYGEWQNNMFGIKYALTYQNKVKKECFDTLSTTKNLITDLRTQLETAKKGESEFLPETSERLLHGIEINIQNSTTWIIVVRQLREQILETQRKLNEVVEFSKQGNSTLSPQNMKTLEGDVKIEDNTTWNDVVIQLQNKLKQTTSNLSVSEQNLKKAEEGGTKYLDTKYTWAETVEMGRSGKLPINTDTLSTLQMPTDSQATTWWDTVMALKGKVENLENKMNGIRTTMENYYSDSIAEETNDEKQGYIVFWDNKNKTRLGSLKEHVDLHKDLLTNTQRFLRIMSNTRGQNVQFIRVENQYTIRWMQKKEIEGPGQYQTKDVPCWLTHSAGIDRVEELMTGYTNIETQFNDLQTRFASREMSYNVLKAAHDEARTNFAIAETEYKTNLANEQTKLANEQTNLAKEQTKLANEQENVATARVILKKIRADIANSYNNANVNINLGNVAENWDYDSNFNIFFRDNGVPTWNLQNHVDLHTLLLKSTKHLIEKNNGKVCLNPNQEGGLTVEWDDGKVFRYKDLNDDQVFKHQNELQNEVQKLQTDINFVLSETEEKGMSDGDDEEPRFPETVIERFQTLKRNLQVVRTYLEQARGKLEKRKKAKTAHNTQLLTYVEVE